MKHSVVMQRLSRWWRHQGFPDHCTNIGRSLWLSLLTFWTYLHKIEQPRNGPFLPICTSRLFYTAASVHCPKDYVLLSARSCRAERCFPLCNRERFKLGLQNQKQPNSGTKQTSTEMSIFTPVCNSFVW